MLYTFADAARPPFYVGKGGAPWTVVTKDTLQALRSPAIGHDQETVIYLLAGAGTFSCKYTTDSEASCDYFNIYINGVSVAQQSGTRMFTTYTTTLAEPSIIAFRYSKDVSDIVGQDCAWITDIDIADPPADFNTGAFSFEDGIVPKMHCNALTIGTVKAWRVVDGVVSRSPTKALTRSDINVGTSPVVATVYSVIPTTGSNIDFWYYVNCGALSGFSVYFDGVLVGPLGDTATAWIRKVQSLAAAPDLGGLHWIELVYAQGLEDVGLNSVFIDDLTITADVVIEPVEPVVTFALTKITMHIFKLDGTPAGAATSTLENTVNGGTALVAGWKGVTVRATAGQAFNVGTDIIGTETVTTVTNASGYAELSVIKGSTVTVTCPAFGKSVVVDTTGLDTVDISTFF